MVKGTFGFRNGTAIVIEAGCAHLTVRGNSTFVETFAPWWVECRQESQALFSAFRTGSGRLDRPDEGL